jgi:hypothetical protein
MSTKVAFPRDRVNDKALQSPLLNEHGEYLLILSFSAPCLRPQPKKKIGEIFGSASSSTESNRQLRKPGRISDIGSRTGGYLTSV